MIAKKCNRCGVLYERYNESRNQNKANGFRFLNIDKNQDACQHEKLDLCPECMKELYEWFKSIKKTATGDCNSIYISGPITGLKEEDARAAFEKAEKLLEEDYERIVNPMRFESAYQSAKMCKAIYMLKNWEGSKGACIERLTALQLGMKIIYED